MSEEDIPEVYRLRGGGFGWFEDALSPVEQFKKELAELDEAARDSSSPERVFAKLDRLLALTDPEAILVGLTPSEREVGRELLLRWIAQWRVPIADRLDEIEDELTDLGMEEE
jgi:hypothetical protein